MIPDALAQLTAELTTRREPFVTATVVRVQRPTSVRAGATAVVRADGSIEGFVGGVCTANSVRLHSLRAIEGGEPVLLRILPDPQHPAGHQDYGDAGEEVADEDGAVTVRNPCLSGGSIEVFLEPSLPAPRMLVVGDSPIVAALARIGPEVGFEVLTATPGGEGLRPDAGDFALVVAAHGRGELGVLRAALEAGVPYVGLVASARRGAAVLDELSDEGVDRELLERVDTPAGLELGARTAAEIALAIIAQVVQVRRTQPAGVATAAGATATQEAPASAPATSAGAGSGGLSVIASASGGSTAAARPGGAAARAGVATAVDPICGMTVLVEPGTPSAERDGESFYFCCEGCRRAFLAQTA